MNETREARGTARDALIVSVGLARLLGWVAVLAAVGVMIYAVWGVDKPQFMAFALILLGFGLTWILLARIGGALGAMVGQ